MSAVENSMNRQADETEQLLAHDQDMMFDGGNICNTCDRTTDDAADDSRPTHQQNPQCGSSAGGNGVPLEDVPPPQDSTTISETFGYDEDHMALLDLQLDRYRYLLLQNREELQQARQTNDDLHSQLDIYEGMLTAYECTIVDLQSRVNLEVLTEDTNCPQLAEAGDSCLGASMPRVAYDDIPLWNQHWPEEYLSSPFANISHCSVARALQADVQRGQILQTDATSQQHDQGRKTRSEQVEAAI